MSDSDKSTIAGGIGIALTRVVVPLWVLAGASFKLYERTASNLPSVILKTAKDLHWDLDVLLRTLIGLEFLAVGVMLFVPRLARAMAIFMLSCFCLILLGEMYRQAAKCGCFGSIPMKPWHMLLIDGTLLAAVIWFRPRRKAAEMTGGRQSYFGPAIAMVVIGAVGFAISFVVPDRPPTPQDERPAVVVEHHNDGNGNGNEVPTPPPPPVDLQVNQNPLAVPNSWYIKTTPGDEWKGKSWREIDLFQFMPRWPKDLDHGKHYVVFYSRTCEHCEAMFRDYLVKPMDGPVTAVEIPSSKTVLTGVGAWEMPPSSVELLALPLGCNWIITPPLMAVFVDGKVTCAIEGEGYEKCLGK